MEKRINFLGAIIVLSFSIILMRLFSLIVIHGDYYSEKLSDMTYNIVWGNSTPRGRIYDRNMNLLVDNKSIPVIYYNNPNNLDSVEEIKYAYEIVKHIKVDYSQLTKDDIKSFLIDRDENKLSDKITEKEWDDYRNRKLSSDEIYDLKCQRISDAEIKKLTKEDLMVAYIYHLMNKGYYYEDKVIKDVNITDKEIAYVAENYENLGGFNIKYNWKRVYPYGDTFRGLLGNISSISKEEKNYYLANGYSLNDIVGTSYLEKQYESILKGQKAKYEIINKKLNLIEEGKKGNDIVLTIDIKLQKAVDKILEEELIAAQSYGATEYYDHAFVIIQEPNTGEILTISGKQIVKNNKGYKVYDYTPNILTDTVTPGSIVKGASMSVGYSTGAIKIGEYMYDSCIKIYSKPAKCSWSKLGRINDLDALAYSSNIYQFKTAFKVAGFNYSYNKKFDLKEGVFATYRQMFNQYGLGVKTEIDLPNETAGNIGKDESSDLLLNYTIGQYDTYTALQLSQYITTIASDGKRLKPHLLKAYFADGERRDVEPTILNELTLENKYLKRIQKGFRGVMSYGLGRNYMGSVQSPAGKTGTSESFIDSNRDGIIDKPTLSNTFIGYAPYKNPVMTITVVSPNIVNVNSKSSSRSYANHRITRRISEKFFKMYQ